MHTPHDSSPRRTALAIAALAIAALGAPRVAPAQYQSQSVAVSAGPSMPRGPFADSLRPGYHVTAGVGYHFGETFTFRLEGTYQQLERKLAGSPRNNQMVHFGAAGELSPFGVISPYLVGGYGFAQTLKSGSAPASQWLGAYDLGVGYRYSWPRLSVFGEVRYYRVRGTGMPAMLPWSFGIRI